MPAPPDPLVGHILEGRFRVEGPLGRGGMGLVYAAEDIQLRRRCALKILRPEYAGQPDNVERFLREAQAIARLSHEHIVNIFSMGRDPGGAVFFAMELLQGEDLEARLRNARAAIDWRTVCEWAIQIAQAVEAVHDAGLVHRDLKPGNVFLARKRDGSDTVKLLDFGIVRPEDSEMTNTGATLGTPHYMSPEQIRARPLDRRADIYSFGVLLFRALASRLPFMGEPYQVALLHVEQPAPRLTAVAPERNIPEDLADVVARALAKDPAERYSSMSAIEAALRDLLDADLAVTRPAPRQPTAATRAATPLADTAPAQPAPVASRPAIRPASVPADPVDPPSTLPTMPRMSADDVPVAPPSTSPEFASPFASASAAVVAAPPRSPFVLVAFVGLGLALGALLVVLLSAKDPAPTAAAPPPLAAAATPTPQAPPPPPVATPDPPQPDAAPPPTPPPASARRAAAKKSPAPVDPLKAIVRQAKACRRTHDAEGGPTIDIDYAVGSNGKVTRAVPLQSSALGRCLADIVRRADFPPKMLLGQRISL